MPPKKFEFGKEGDTASSALGGLRENPSLAALLANPEFAAAIQAELSGMVGSSSGFFEALPPKVKERVKLLRLIQEEQLELKDKFEQENRELRLKYEKLYGVLYARRAAIAKGDAPEPTDAEKEAATKLWEKIKAQEEEDDDDEEGEAPELIAAGTLKPAETKDDKPAEKKDDKPAEKKDAVETGATEKPAEKASKGDDEAEEDVAGIPDFWLNVFMNHEDLAELITDRDQEVLEFLRDVRSVEGAVEGHPESFTLEFEFEKNPFFEGTILKKTYDIGPTGILKENNFEGVTGTDIKWKGVKNNVTVEVKKQKVGGGGRGGKRGRGRGGRGGGGSPKVVDVVEKIPSFFHFFDPLGEHSETPDDVPEEDLQDMVMGDYSLGEEIREKVIPYAILWYLGELEAEGMQLDMDGEDDYDSEEDDEDSDEAPAPKKAAPKKAAPKVSGVKALAGADLESDDESDEDFTPPAGKAGDKPPECKQQ